LCIYISSKSELVSYIEVFNKSKFYTARSQIIYILSIERYLKLVATYTAVRFKSGLHSTNLCQIILSDNRRHMNSGFKLQLDVHTLLNDRAVNHDATKHEAFFTRLMRLVSCFSTLIPYLIVESYT